jgi:YfiH family protein
VAAETAAEPVLMRQVHGADVVVVPGGAPAGGPPTCDALATTEPGLALLARAADCVPVLLGDADAGVVAAVHSGRGGLAAGVVPAAVARMHDLGARRITAWVGPRVCGACYEVPDEMRAEVAGVVPEAWSTTRWDTPGLDLGAGVRAQLDRAGVGVVHDVGVCTLEDTAWPSHRRDGAAATRFAGVVWMHA